ncbi:MAG: hypothetical protein CL916_14520 [Deltaproteobacteria bacterium]|nr:hypothetical protein [Deltaproteobacteria bacterium]
MHTKIKRMAVMTSIWMYILLGCSDPKSIDQDEDGFIASEDCDDTDPDVHPLADEICNDIDDNCDGRINLDAVDGSVFLADLDGDGFGNDDSRHNLCAIENGYVELSSGGDCDDDNMAVYPNAVEICNEIDDNCNNIVDENPDNGTYFFLDSDEDGFGDDSEFVFTCMAPQGYIEDNTDCDDSNAYTFPGAAQEDSLTDCMHDEDRDGYGDINVLDDVVSGTDCDDTDNEIYPGAVEICNELDDDCDLLIDDADDSVSDQVLLYSDLDGDGYGDPTNSSLRCLPTEFLIADSSDCDDTNNEINPSAIEICDGVDNDCNGATLEDGMVYRIDGQGVGTDLTSVMANGTPSIPNVYEPVGDEELYFCEGTFSPSISTSSDITIQGFGNVTFLADGINAPNTDLLAVRNYGDATNTNIDGIVFDGYNLAILLNSENEVYNNLTMNDSLIRNGYSIAGASINVHYVDVEVTNSYFEDGTSGYGGLAITGGNSDVIFENVDISNTSESAYVGVYLYEDSTFEMIDTNISGFSYAGVMLSNSHGSCTNSSSSVSSGMASSTRGLYLNTSTWDSTGCDYQSSSSQEENDIDITIASESEYYVGDNATFSCSETSCGTQTLQSFEAFTSYSMSSKVYSNRYNAQTDLTIGFFSVPLLSDTCGSFFVCMCEIDFGMHTYESGVWTEVWTGSKNTFFNGYVSSGKIGHPLRAGDQFALTVEYECDYSLEYRYDSSQISPSNSLLGYETSYVGGSLGVASPDGALENSGTYYDQKVWVETVP